MPRLAAWIRDRSGSLLIGIGGALLVGLVAAPLTIASVRRVDRAWRLVRRAARYPQRSGALVWSLTVSVFILIAAIVAAIAANGVTNLIPLDQWEFR
jgi:hypothetical protein